MTVPAPAPIGSRAAGTAPPRPPAARPGSRAILAFALWLTGALAGCGDSSPSTPDPNPPPDPSGPSPPTPTPLPAVLGNACPGIVVRSDPPTRAGDRNEVELVIEWENRSRGSTITWTGPYATFENPDPDNPPRLEIDLRTWTVEATAALTRHTFRVGWPTSKELELDLGAGATGCRMPTVVCSTERCELGRQR